MPSKSLNANDNAACAVNAAFAPPFQFSVDCPLFAWQADVFAAVQDSAHVAGRHVAHSLVIDRPRASGKQAATSCNYCHSDLHCSLACQVSLALEGSRAAEDVASSDTLSLSFVA